MTDTSITLAASAPFVTTPVTVVASADLFAATDIGRLLAIMAFAPIRFTSAAYPAGQVFVASYAGIDRLYRVIAPGTTAAVAMAGTVPDYDLNAPREVGATVADGTATLKYLGQGKLCWGFGTITAYTDPQHVTVSPDPTGPFVTVTPSSQWKLGEFSDARGWPASVTFHSGRTWWGGTKTKPQTLWASATGDYENMTSSEPDGQVLDTSALTITLDDDQVNTVRWLASFNKGLAAGTASGEFTVVPINANGAIAPNNVRAVRQTDRGSDASTSPTRANGVILFMQRGGRKFRQLEYDFGTDTFATVDLTQLADHLTGSGIVESAYVTQPDGMIWLLRKDGKLACLTFDREQKVRAWSLHTIGGSNAVVESIAAVPAPDGTTDELSLAVARTINGQTVRTFEYLRAGFRQDIDTQAGAYFVDCGLTYSGTPAGTFAGLTHLEGETVKILADGSMRTDAVVRGGTVAITGPDASTVHIGLAYTSRFESLQPELQADLGTAQGQVRRISEIIIRFLESGGGQYGRDEALEPIILRTLAAPMTTATPLFTGDRRVAFPAGWDREARIVIESSDPLPLTVLALISDVSTNG